jgi:hypothetical protein
VLVDPYEEEWTRLWWVRLEGVATALDEGPEWKHALARLRSKYEQYRSELPTGRVIALRVPVHQLVADEYRLVVLGAASCGGSVVTRLSPSFSRQKF